jgi:antirestriction protein ArdC
MKKDIYQIITEQVIKGLEEGGQKWFQSWAGNTDTMTLNHKSGTIYSGINQMLLSMAMYFNNYSSREFITFNQAKELGGKCEKGCSHMVVFSLPSYFVTSKSGKKIYLKTDSNRKPIIPKGYTESDVQNSRITRYFRVWNLDKVEGIEDKHNIDDVIKGSVFEPIKEADLVYSNMRKKPTLEHRDNIGCYYKPSQHLINMSSPNTFISSDDYYKVLFHEMVHSTGHKDLLNRKTLNTTNANKTAYSQEELVAELGAMFLTNILGLEPKDSEKNSQAYINGWIKHLKNNPREIVYASSQSQKAVEYILNKERKVTKKK